MKDPLANFPGYALRRAAAVTMAQLNRRLSRYSLRHVDAAALLFIDESPGITSSTLGRALDIQRANMVPLIGRLESASLVVRTPIDGKSHGLSLTETGRQLVKQVRQEIGAFEAELIDRVPARHREHLLPALDALWR